MGVEIHVRKELKTIHLVVDLDNTLLDATTPHLKYYNHVSGLNFTEKDVNDVYLYRLYNWKQEERENIYHQYGHRIHWESIPYPRAIDTLGQLSAQHQITIMTARPEKFREVTTQWLAYHGATYDKLIFTEDKYKEFIELGGDVLVDDAPHYAIEFSRNCRPVILFDQPYNRLIHSDYIYRGADWLEVKEHVDYLNALRNK